MADYKISNISGTFSELDIFVDYLIKGNRRECLNYVDEYLKNNPGFIRLYEEVFKQALYKIGELWEYNRITVATEHLATSIIEFLLNHLYHESGSVNNQGKKIILSSTENEEHQVGIRMVADIFENSGWETFYLGADMPANELIIFISSINPDLLALSLSVFFNLPLLENMLLAIRSAYPELPVIVGGQAFRHGGKEVLDKISKVMFVPDLYALELLIKNKNNFFET